MRHKSWRDHNGLAIRDSRKSTVNRAFSTGFSPPRLSVGRRPTRGYQSSTRRPRTGYGAEEGERRVCVYSVVTEIAPQFSLLQPPLPPRFHIIMSAEGGGCAEKFVTQGKGAK